MGRKNLIAGVALAIVILAGVAGFALYRLRASAAPAAAKAAPKPDADPEISLPGRIQARETVDVAVPIDGKVVAFHAEVGDEVYEGQLLAEIRSEGLETAQQHAASELERGTARVQNLESSLSAARLEASRASADAMRVRSELDRASRNFERQRLLINEGATPRQVYEKAEKDYQALVAESKDLETVTKQADDRVSTLSRELDAARRYLEDKLADAEAAKTRVEAGQILAPANGTIAGRRGAQGDEVHPTMTDLFQIATNSSQLEVVVEPSPADLPRIQPGQDAAITVADVPDVLIGKVASVQDGKAVVQFANPSPLVKPGYTAQVRIRVT